MTKRLLALLLVCHPLVANAGDACEGTAPPPAEWQRIYGRAVSFRAPAGASMRQVDSDDTTLDAVTVDGQSAWIESGMAHLVGASIDVLEGDTPTIAAHDSGADAKHLVATWMLDAAAWHFVAVLTVQYRTSEEKAKACALVRSARPLARIDDLKLVRVVMEGNRRCAVLRDAQTQRYACPGAYVTRDYGRLDAVTADAAEVLELVRDSPDWHWKERRSALPARHR